MVMNFRHQTSMVGGKFIVLFHQPMSHVSLRLLQTKWYSFVLDIIIHCIIEDVSQNALLWLKIIE